MHSIHTSKFPRSQFTCTDKYSTNVAQDVTLTATCAITACR